MVPNMWTRSRQHRRLPWWQWLALGLMALYSVDATIVCDDCRSLDLQEAPGMCYRLANCAFGEALEDRH